MTAFDPKRTFIGVKGLVMAIRTILRFIVVAFLFGCAAQQTQVRYQVRMMPRDSGTVYVGEASGLGNGPASITIDGKAYSGTWVTVADSGSLTLLNTYGTNNQGGKFSGYGSAQSVSTRGTGVALLSAADNSGLRCEYTNESGSGVGVCRDDKGRLFDVQITKQ